MNKQFASLLAVAPLLVFPLCLHAQSTQDTQTGTGQSQTGGIDCSDPMQANSPLCTSSQQLNNSLFPQFPMTGSPWAGQGGTMRGLSGYGNMTGTESAQNPYYTDNENLARQYAARYYQLQQHLPPEPLTEFQKFVASTTGQVLPIFGADLFRTVPSTFAPLDQTPVPPDYTIGPGDELRIRVWGQVNFRADVRVDRAGDVYLPQVGAVHVAGLAFSTLDEHLRQAVGRIYHNFDLTADVGQIRAIQVYLAGSARSPGVYTVSSLSTLVDALFASGGPAATGSLRHIELRRGGVTVTDFDLYDLLIRGDKSKDVPLQSGDVIFIPPAGAQVALTGSVRNPGIYELRTGDTLSDAIADAGNVSAVAAQTRVSIERIDNRRSRQAMEVAFNPTGLATRLENGDLVQVYSIVPQYEKTVTLRGNIANPGHFAWHPGMRISDLIPDKDSLITRNYWWKRAQLGLPGPEFEPLQRYPQLRQPSTPLDLSRLRLPNQATSSTSTTRQGQTQSGATGAAQDLSANSNAQDQNLAAGFNETTQQDQALAAGLDADQSQAASDQPRAGNSTLAADRMQVNENIPGFTRTQVGPIAPEIDWDYAVVERLDPDTLKTVLLPFDLGRLVLQHDSSQDLALLPGDVVSVLSQADVRVPIAQQTKFVRLDGEFVHAGVYTVKSGETLRDLVKRAGGFTPNAYLYGSEFTRESARMVQQRRMNEYIQTLELQMQRGNLALASSAAVSAQDLASSSAAQTSEQQLLNRLRQIRATGRIVLEFRPHSNGLDALPDITLENGDRFVVPSVPASVNVVGAVYDQSSFIYESSRRAGSYLRLAGGPNRDADQKHIFIIRADGSVISRAATSGLWGNEFENLRMNPGDTIVVPDKNFKPSALRGFLDYTQLFSQLAFGAAALSVIFP
jgi:protein involved in polysaccharide export with SLBB domain